MEELKVKINTGAVKVKLTDENDIEIGYFSFVPTDMGIIKRWETFADEVANIKASEDMTAAEIENVSNDIKRWIDTLLGNESSATIFARFDPLTVDPDGNFYFETVLDGIASVIEQVFKTRVEAKKARIQRAVKNYV